jgi:hypothetical protein
MVRAKKHELHCAQTGAREQCQRERETHTHTHMIYMYIY